MSCALSPWQVPAHAAGEVHLSVSLQLCTWPSLSPRVFFLGGGGVASAELPCDEELILNFVVLH